MKPTVSCIATGATIKDFRVLHSMERDLTREFFIDSKVHGHHVYQHIWTPIVGESLICAREEDNEHDRFAVAVVQSDGIADTIVGHLPRTISRLCSLFIGYHGSIRCTITGHHHYSMDMSNGGMEVPCRLHFLGVESELKK